MIKQKSIGSRLFDITNYTLLALYAISTVIPIIYVFAGSFTASEELTLKGFVLFPTKFSLEGYRYILESNSVPRAFLTSVFITVVGTFINMLLTSLTAYPLAHSDLAGRKTLMTLVTFTMVFNPGLIPAYLVVKNVGLINSIWSVIIPIAISPFNLIVLKNFFQQIPGEIEESAKIDGANDLVILFRLIMPLSMASLASLTLFYAVINWNSYFNALMYINDAKKWPLQVLLRQIVLISQGANDFQTQVDNPPPAETVKLAIIVVATFPILLVYPFLQKHFVKGVMLGSIKG